MFICCSTSTFVGIFSNRLSLAKQTKCHLKAPYFALFYKKKQYQKK